MSPEWLYFGDPAATHVLWLAHPGDDPHPDAYCSMNDEMTVFGYGRLKLEPFLRKTPGTFVVGLLESTDHVVIDAVVALASEPVVITKGPIENVPDSYLDGSGT